MLWKTTRLDGGYVLDYGKEFPGREVLHTIFVEQHRTADFQTTKEIRRILENDGNEDDLVAFMRDRFLPVDEIAAHDLAKELMKNAPEPGYLTISNAPQWRMQYGRAIAAAGNVNGLMRLR